MSAFLHASGSHETCEFTLSREAVRLSLSVIVVESGMRGARDERNGSVGVDAVYEPWKSPGAVDVFIGIFNSGTPTDFALILWISRRISKSRTSKFLSSRRCAKDRAIIFLSSIFSG